MREIAAATITTTYQPLLDPAYDPTDATHWGLVTPARQFFIQNLTDQTVFISFRADVGANDIAFVGPSTIGKTLRNVMLSSNGYFVSDISTNKIASAKDDGVALAEGVIVTVKLAGAQTTTNSVYFSYWCSSTDL